MNFSFEELFAFIGGRYEEIIEHTAQHLGVVVVSLVIGMIISVGVGMLTWNRPLARSTVIAATAVSFTIPSLALLVVLVVPFGFGWVPTIIALSFYSLLPMVQNTVAGLREVPPAVMESAKGVGMGPTRIMFRVQLPIAWPVILTGVRISAQLTVGVAAIAAYVAGPGLGDYIFKGLALLGSKNSLYLALVGTVGVVILALLIDGAFVLITRYTTSRGLRA